MRGKGGVYTVLTVLLLAMGSCSTTRYVPEGEYRLRQIVIVADEEAPKKERIRPSEVERYVRQSPNRKFLGTNLYLWWYNASDTAKTNWWNRTLRRIGDEPVILDSTLIERSVQNISTYVTSRGFFDSSVGYTVETKKKTATVTYYLTQGEPYRIGDIGYDFQDEFLRPVIMRDSARTLLRTGDIFDLGVLNSERSRIADYLRDNGYFEFTVNNIAYLADSSGGDRFVDLTMIVRQHLEGYDERGEPVHDNNTVYRIGDIYINPDYDPVAAVSDDDYYADMDTLVYRGLNIIYQNKPKVRPRILRQAVNLYPNYLYSTSEVQQAYSNIMRLGYYRSASIIFDDVTDTTSNNLVTFIGGEDEMMSGETTREGYLACHINCIPSLRQSYKIDLEGSIASNFYALGATVGYQNRNLFRGAELFDASVTGRYEFQRARGKKGSFEIGASTSFTFPRFFFFFNVDRYNRTVNPRTRMELSINSQHRPYYQRTLTSARLGYSWSNRGNSSFAIRPIDVNLLKMNKVDEDFIDSLTNNNEYLRNSYTSQLIAGISGSYTYNSQQRQANLNRDSYIFRLNWETMGNLFNGLTHLMGSPSYDDGEKYYKIFGIRYAQYFRIDASFSNRLVVGNNSSLVYRVLAGGGLSYGNSNSIPFDRLFYSGGSNSMRGWIARMLGPGTSPVISTRYPTQLGNFKLEFNLESRFPIWGFFHGAVFLDAGNIWYLKQGDYPEEAVFKFDRFVKQLGLNTGVGARLDFDFFVIRFDWGIKLHNPNNPAGNRWIDRFKLSDTVLQFGVGYPF